MVRKDTTWINFDIQGVFFEMISRIFYKYVNMRKIPEDVVDEIFRLYQEWNTYKYIAETLWVSVALVIKKLNAIR